MSKQDRGTACEPGAIDAVDQVADFQELLQVQNDGRGEKAAAKVIGRRYHEMSFAISPSRCQMSLGQGNIVDHRHCRYKAGLLSGVHDRPAQGMLQMRQNFLIPK